MATVKYTEAECLDMLPKWQENVTSQAQRLVEAIAAEDWRALRGVAVELRWAGANLKGIAADLITHQATKPWLIRPAEYDGSGEVLARFATDTEAEAWMTETYPHRNPATYYTPGKDEGYIETTQARHAQR